MPYSTLELAKWAPTYQNCESDDEIKHHGSMRPTGMNSTTGALTSCSSSRAAPSNTIPR